jgi:hypothetical protein
VKKEYTRLDESTRVEFLRNMLDEETPSVAWIAREHAELVQAVWEGRDEVVEGDDLSISPKLHLTLHGIVERQYHSGDPPAVQELVDLLLDDGWRRHEIMHLICAANIDELLLMLNDEESFNPDRFAVRLKRLHRQSRKRAKLARRFT